MDTVAAITTLDQTEISQPGTILGVHGHTMELKIPRQVGVGSAVKVEANDTLALGEVFACRPDAEGYTVWVDLIEALHGVNELSRLAKALIS